MKDIILASGNKGKMEEFVQLFSDINIKSLSDFNLDSPVENANTFVGNALIKAQFASRNTGLPALADDSGICVDYLNGAPGLYSARFAGDNSSDFDNRSHLLNKLIDVPFYSRKAHFICVLVLIRSFNDPDPLIATGRVSGYVTTEELGNNGHGYDSVFFYPPSNKTFAQMTLEEKNLVSHRSLAIKELKNLINFYF